MNAQGGSRRRGKLAKACAATMAMLLGGSLLWGCGERKETWEQQLDVRGPFKVASQVLWVDGTRGLVFALDPAADTPVVRRAPLMRNLVAARVDPTGKALLVLTAGKERDRIDQVAEAPTLSIVRPQDQAAPQVTPYELPAPFTHIDLGPEGRMALLRLDGSANATPLANTGLFRNANQVAVVDLDAPASEDNPTLRTLRSFGTAPLAAVISPRLTIGDTGTRRLAVVLANNNVTLVDLDNPTRSEITVRLVPEASAGAAEVIPEQVLFVPEKGLVLLRARNAEDLYALALQPKEPEGDEGNDFRPVISQPSVGRPVADMVLLGRPATHVLASDGNSGLVLVDLETSELSAKILRVGSPVDSLVGIPQDDPQTVVGFSRNSNQASLQIVDVERMLRQTSGAVVARSAVTFLQDVVVAPDERHVLLIHQTSGLAVSILDLSDAHRAIARIEGDLLLKTYDFVQGTHLVGASASRSRIGLLALDDLESSELKLDFTPNEVVAVGDHVVVQHDLTQGVVTVLPASATSQQEATVLWGFLLDGLLDDPMKD